MEKLVELMTANTDICRGKVPFGANKAQHKETWEEFLELQKNNKVLVDNLNIFLKGNIKIVLIFLQVWTLLKRI